MTKTLKFLGWLIFGPIVWFILSIIVSVILAVAFWQIATGKLPSKPTDSTENFGLTPPDKSAIVLN